MSDEKILYLDDQISSYVIFIISYKKLSAKQQWLNCRWKRCIVLLGTFYICRFFVTCGNDGDVRIWEGLDDDDPKFITVGEKVYSLALKVGQMGA